VTYIACQSKTKNHFFTTEAQRAQSFTLLTAPTALLTIQSFSLCPLCLCGEMLIRFKILNRHKKTGTGYFTSTGFFVDKLVKKLI